MDINTTLKTYFKDLRKIELLSGDEQNELVIKAKKGDKKALDKLIESNLRFVVTIAKEYLYSKIPLEDLISEGNIGLFKAVEKFDLSKNIKFISYAVWWIRQSIVQSIYENGSIVRLPINRISINNKISKTKDILLKQLNREPTPQEISDFCDMCEADVKKSFSDCVHAVEIETQYNDESELTVCDYLEGDEYSNMEQRVNRSAVYHEIGEVFSDLNKRESKILKMYFGLETGEEMNLRQIGEQMNLTNERVRQIKDFALKKLRTYGKSQKLREFLNCKI
jgi:RNA polymerase primary sigma factor